MSYLKLNKDRTSGKKYQQYKAERIKEYNRLRFQANLSEKITCCCGSTFCIGGKNHHERTKKHIGFIH
jgi:hypothetical protein